MMEPPEIKGLWTLRNCFACSALLLVWLVLPIAIAQQPGGELVRLAAAGSAAELQLALAAGADPDAADEWGERPLVAAAAQGSAEIVKILLEAGDRKSTRLNSSHVAISYAVFC